MRYSVEIEGDINEDFPHRVNSLREAVQLFREAVERGDYDDDCEIGGKISATVKIWGSNFDEGGYFQEFVDCEDVEITYKGKK